MRILGVAALAAAPLAAQSSVSLDTSFLPPEVVIDVVSGIGAVGGPDANVTVLEGKPGGFPAPLTARSFWGARNGPPAQILSSTPWTTLELTTHPDARWIGVDQESGLGTNQVPGLFAVDFEVPNIPIHSAHVDFTFVADETLGQPGIPGLFVNEVPVNGTTLPFVEDEQNALFDRNVAQAIRPGTNTLYVYTINNLLWGGVMFHARFVINQPEAEECAAAQPAYLDDNAGTTFGYSTSPEVAACGIQNDRWYSFVPPRSGALTAQLSSTGGGDYVPGLVAFDGSCGSLTQIGCATGTPTTDAVWNGQAVAGEPILFAVGGTTNRQGQYNLRLTIDIPDAGLVYGGNGHLYKVSSQTFDIAGARAWAQSQGGYLVAINDQAESDWITQQLASGIQLWIGLSDEVNEGIWLWDSGEPFGFTSWNVPFEPNDFPLCNGEDYVEIVGGGLWNDLNTGPNPCGNHVRRGLAEIPASGLASVLDLGGGCGTLSLAPVLFSEPHVLGTIADIAILDANPLETVTLFRSPTGAAAVPLGDCVLHLDFGQLTTVLTTTTNEYGSVSTSSATPNNPALIGQKEIWQAQVFPTSGGVVYSNALEIQFGN